MLSTRNKIKLYFFDHRRNFYDQINQKGLVGTLKVEPLLDKTNSGKLIVTSPENATHVFVHLDTENCENARLGNWNELIYSDQIVLCLTSSSGFDINEYPHRFDQIGAYKRATFFCRNSEILKKEEQAFEAFTAFCELDIVRAKSIVNRESSSVPAPLQRILFVNSDQYLSALAILCQAYLLLNASASQNLASNSKEIALALEEMGYFDALREQKIIPLLSNIQQKLDEMTPQWWFETLTCAEFGETYHKTQAVAAKIRSEWEIISASSKPKQYLTKDWQNIQLLMNAIGLIDDKDSNSVINKSTPLELNPLLVAKAYRSISSTLSQLN